MSERARGDRMRVMAKQHRNTWKTRLNALRKRMGLSQIEFAEALGVQVGTLRSWLYKGIIPGGSATRLIELLENIHGK